MFLDTPAARARWAEATTAAGAALSDAHHSTVYADERERISEAAAAFDVARFLDALTITSALAAGARSLHTRTPLVTAVENIATLLALEVD